MPIEAPADDRLTIRLAAADERLNLEALQREASLMHDAYREALLEHPDAIELPAEQIAEGHVLVAERNGEIVGFAVVLPREDGTAELDGLFVLPRAWRTGVGGRLVAAGKAMAASRNATILHVVGAPEAREFYEACGFVTTGEAPTRFGPALSMRAAVA